jgi:hypothetical protein
MSMAVPYLMFITPRSQYCVKMFSLIHQWLSPLQQYSGYLDLKIYSANGNCLIQGWTLIWAIILCSWGD